MKQIEVVIENGRAQVKTQGFEGTACIDATKDLERAMGATTEDVKTPEYDFKHVQSAGQ